MDRSGLRSPKSLCISLYFCRETAKNLVKYLGSTESGIRSQRFTEAVSSIWLRRRRVQHVCCSEGSRVPKPETLFPPVTLAMQFLFENKIYRLKYQLLQSTAINSTKRCVLNALASLSLSLSLPPSLSLSLFSCPLIVILRFVGPSASAVF